MHEKYKWREKETKTSGETAITVSNTLISVDVKWFPSQAIKLGRTASYTSYS